MGGKNQIDIDGVVLTKKSTKAWRDDFLDWLESRKESFGGGCLGDGKSEARRGGSGDEP